jgi:hypothetical protein
MNNIEQQLAGSAPKGLSRNEKETAWNTIESAMRAPVSIHPSPFVQARRAWRNILVPTLIGGLILGGSTATVYASGNSLPGDILFPIEIATEKVQLYLERDVKDKEMLEVKFAEERLSEVREVFSITFPDIPTTETVPKPSFSTTTGASTTGPTATSTQDQEIESRRSKEATRPDGTSKKEQKKREKEERAIAATLRDLERSRLALEKVGSRGGALILDDIIEDIEEARSGSVDRPLVSDTSTEGGAIQKIDVLPENGVTATPDNSSRNDSAIDAPSTTTPESSVESGTQNEVPKDDTRASKDGDNGLRQEDDTSSRKDERLKRRVEKVEVCHVDRERTRTIKVSPASAREHVAHGDELGECPMSEIRKAKEIRSEERATTTRRQVGENIPKLEPDEGVEAEEIGDSEKD